MRLFWDFTNYKFPIRLLIMYENSSSPVSARQQHEAEILRRMSAARSSAFNVVAPHSFEGHHQGKGKLFLNLSALTHVDLSERVPICISK